MTTEILPVAVECAGSPPVARVVRGAAEFAQLDGPWQRLALERGPIEGFDWADACRQTVALGQRLAVVAIERDGDLAALAALAGKRRRGIRRLVQLGVGELFEPQDFLARDDHSLAALAAALVRLRSPLWLERLPADSAALAVLESAFRGRAVIVRRPAARAPYIALDPSWREPETHLNSGRRSDLRRRAAKPISWAR